MRWFSEFFLLFDKLITLYLFSFLLANYAKDHKNNFSRAAIAAQLDFTIGWKNAFSRPVIRAGHGFFLNSQ